MSAIKLDPELRAKLNGLDEHLEIQDDTGKVVGHFLPDEVYMTLLYAWAREQFSNDVEERRQAMSEPGGYTTEEAIAFVDKLVADYKGNAQ